MPTPAVKLLIPIIVAALCHTAMAQTTQPSAPTSQPSAADENRLREAYEQIDLGRYAEASKILDTIHSENQTNPYYYFALGRVNAGTKHYELAIVAYTTALQHMPEMTEASFRIALAYACMEYNTEAVKRIDELIKKNPADQRYYYAKSLFYINLKEYDKAIAAMIQAQKLNGRFIETVAKKADAVINFHANEAAAAKKRTEEIEKLRAQYNVVLEALNNSKTTLQNAQNEKAQLQTQYEGEESTIRQAYNDTMTKAYAVYNAQLPPPAMQASDPAGYAQAKAAADATLARAQAAAAQIRNKAIAALIKRYQPLAAAAIAKINKYTGIVATQSAEEKKEKAKVTAAETAEKNYKPPPPFDILVSLRDIPMPMDSSATGIPTSSPTSASTSTPTSAPATK